MQYSTIPSSGDRVSVLGYGCMRFTRKGGAIDQEKAEREMIYAITHGVNYFDTAYIYPGNEAALGKLFQKGWRSRVFLATKIPHYKIRSLSDLERIFAEELSRLYTDYIDYYLMHMLPSVQTWQRLCTLGVSDWLEQKKREGVIRHIGFSFHGGTKNFKALIDTYPWDFCQIQYNYMDTEEQAGDKGYALAEKLGVPLVIMEPVKGGSLAALPEEVEAPFKEARPEASTSSWAFRWVASHPDVHVVLSGMSTMEQVEDNLKTFGNFEPLTEKEEKIVEGVATAIKARTKNGCTGCAYCMPCPHGVNIPKNFRIWNDLAMYGNEEITRQNYFKYLPEAERADKCKACGKCEKVCPQSLSIRENLKQVQKEMEALKNK